MNHRDAYFGVIVVIIVLVNFINIIVIVAVIIVVIVVLNTCNRHPINFAFWQSFTLFSPPPAEIPGFHILPVFFLTEGQFVYRAKIPVGSLAFRSDEWLILCVKKMLEQDFRNNFFLSRYFVYDMCNHRLKKANYDQFDIKK